MKPRLALSMIVRNAARDLGRCLDSVRGIVDEALLADTGSTDNTIEIARRCGAQVISIPWENDFAKARNLALAPLHSSARVDWILVLDADEMLDSFAPRTIPSLLRLEDYAGFVVPIRNYFRGRNAHIWDTPAVENDLRLPSSREYPAFVAHGNVRLFRCDPEIYFVARIHESVGPRILVLGRKVCQCDLVIHHFGATADPESLLRKNRFYRDLGRQKLFEMPNNAQAHFELGIVEFDNFHDYPAALPLFRRASELKPEFAIAWLFLAMTEVRLKRNEEALTALECCERHGYRNALLFETRGDALYNVGKFAEASRAYKRALRKMPNRAAIESKLGLALVRAGSSNRGLPLLERAAHKEPELADLHDRLIQAHVWLDRIADAATAAEQKLARCSLLTPADFLRAASIRARLGENPRAMALLERGLAIFPGFPRLQAAISEMQQSETRELMVVSEHDPP
jgi:tetratricopeptide (TPR) repeat protein